jgi:hypothetical protein
MWWAWAGCLAIAVTACGLVGGAPPPGGAVTLLDFSGSDFPFDNPVQGEMPGFAAGKWLLQGGTLDQVEGRQDNLASHLRYRGKAFGSDDGRAGRQYGLDVTCSVAREAESSSVHGYPTGILACMPYYRDPTHYLMLVAARQELACWWVDGQRPAGATWPESARLWSRWLEAAMEASGSIRWGADVDIERRQVAIRVDGRPVATVEVPGLDDRPHWVALAANGNFVRFDDLRLVHRR